MTKQNVSRNWRLKMKEQRELRAKGIDVLHQRVVLLCEIYDDKEFARACEDNGVDILDELDREVEDVATTFMVLKQVMESYPSAAEWRKHGVRQLIADVLANSRKKERTREVISWKERALAAEKEAAALKAENERLRADISSLTARVDELRASIGFATGRQLARSV